MGNVRDWGDDTQRLFASEQAKAVRKYIADGNCACPLASQWLNNVLLTPRHMLRVLYTLLVRFSLAPKNQPVERRSRVVHPEDVTVNITGTSARSAIVLREAGTVPAPQEVELPKFDDAPATRSTAPVDVRFMVTPGETKALYRVQQIRQMSPSTYVLRVEKNDVTFSPGQYFVIGKQGSFDAREYTVYSSLTDDFLEFLIAEVDGGRVSPTLRTCAPGDMLEMEGPTGYFRIEEQTRASAKHCFIATGSGIAPFHSFVQSYPDLDYTLLHGVRYASDCFDQDAYEPERYIACVSREEGGAFHGRVTEYLKTHPIDPEALYYLCGNCDMLFEVYEILVQHSVPRGHIVSEVFY